MAGAVLVLLSVLVIPIFRDIFTGFDLQLPWITLLNLTVALWIATCMAIHSGCICSALCGTYFRFDARAHAVLRSFKSVYSAFFGRATAIARLSQFMADLLEAGLSVPDTLKVAGFLTNRKGLRQSVWRLADQCK